MTTTTMKSQATTTTATGGRRLRSSALVGGLFAAALAMAGCGSSAPFTNATIDVTVTVDTALGLDSATITATAPGKAPLSKTFAVHGTVTSLEWTVQVAAAIDPLPATLNAAGYRNGVTPVAYSATAQVGPGQVVDVLLALKASCANLPCTNGLQCQDGVCRAVPNFVPASAGSDASSEGASDDGPADGAGDPAVPSTCAADADCIDGD